MLLLDNLNPVEISVEKFIAQMHLHLYFSLDRPPPLSKLPLNHFNFFVTWVGSHSEQIMAYWNQIANKYTHKISINKPNIAVIGWLTERPLVQDKQNSRKGDEK